MLDLIEIKNILEVERHIEGIQVAIFDLDDTLYSEKDYVHSGYHAIAEHIDEITDLENKLWEAFEKGQPAIDFVLKDEGVYTKEKASELLDIYRNHYPTITLYKGVEELFEFLRSQGIRIGIITDGRPNGQHNKIKALDFEKYCDEIIVTDELGGVEFRKPAPTAFEKMQKDFKVEFREMVYVGDNIKKDFIAPQKLGMRAIWYRNVLGLYNKSEHQK